MVKIPSNLVTLVKERYNAARLAGEVEFKDTELAIVHVNQIPASLLPIQMFQLRHISTLSKKAKSTPSNGPKKPFDPFENPPADLTVTHLPPSHLLVLNKFPIIPEHFILATKEFKEQTNMLEEEDLSAAYACVKAWTNQGKELFGFFNSGEHSGASQRHRHIQFIDVDSMRGEKEDWELLADSLTSSSKTNLDLPFTVFSTKLPDDPSPSLLHGIYKQLHKNGVSTVSSFIAANPESNIKLHNTEDGSSAISYNLGITHNSMVLCPRRSESGSRGTSKSVTEALEQPALNGTVLAGTLLVKSEEAFGSIKKNPGQLLEVLKDIGFPPDSGQLQRKL